MHHCLIEKSEVRLLIQPLRREFLKRLGTDFICYTTTLDTHFLISCIALFFFVYRFYLCIYLLHFRPLCCMFWVIVPVTACDISSYISSCLNVALNLNCDHNNLILFSLLTSPSVFPFSYLFSPICPSSSLYQPPRRRPSAVWSPCAATNMGRAAVPAWPSSWSKWPGSARAAPTAATGGDDADCRNQWLWILMSAQHLMVSKIWAAVPTAIGLNVAPTLL